MRTKTVVDSPVGPLTLVSDGIGLSGLHLEGQAHLPAWLGSVPVQADGFAKEVEQLSEYFAGERRAFDLTLSLSGTPFQRSVWSALLQVPYGSTVSYGVLAALAASPGASRAVGAANARNPVCIIVPCHRVIGTDGNLTGYSGGIERKKALLALEGGGPSSGAEPGTAETAATRTTSA